MPDFLGEGEKINKGEGWKWLGKYGENQVRIRKGDTKLPNSAQHVDYVKINSGGKVLDINSNSINNASEPDSHIPLTDWLKWSDWNKK